MVPAITRPVGKNLVAELVSVAGTRQVWELRAATGGLVVGQVCWHDQLRRYVSVQSTTAKAVFTETVHRNVAEFLEGLNAEERLRQKG